MACLTTAEFADYLSGDGHHHAHVFDCLRCRPIANALRSIGESDDLGAILAEIERRDAAAAAAVAEIELKLPHRWSSLARADERLHTPEAVRRLIQRAGESYGTTPRRSLALAQLAVTCAVVGTVPPSLVFETLKEFAMYSLRVADDLRGALQSLDTAEAFVPLTDDLHRSAAILAHARAYVYGHSTCAQWDRALTLLDECEPVFKRRDPPRCRRVRHLRAAILVRRSDYDRAARLYRHLLETEVDIVSQAHLRKDLAECYCRMGRATEALPLVRESLAVLAPLGHAEVTARAMWTLGMAFSGVGEHDNAVQTLEAVSRFFATAGMNDDELGAELSIIQALLARDPGTDVARRLEEAYMVACALDTAQPLRSSARREAVWSELRSAYERRSLTASILAHASEYLRTLGRGDEAPFVPLQ